MAYTWVATGSVLDGEVSGFAMIPIRGKVEPTQLPIILVGYWSTRTPGWPPSYEDALTEEREGLGQVLCLLDATEEKYNRILQYTEKLLHDPDFIRLRDAIARALNRVPRIEGETVERLAEIYVTPEPEELLA